MQFPFSAIKRLGTGLIAASLVASPVFAADSAIDSGDTAWILTATALVLLMTLPGLALFYAGLVQSKNIVSVLMHHFAIAALMSVLWVIAGYSLAFSGDGAWVGDLANSFMSKITLDSASGTIPESVFAAFQMTFAIITPALIIGAYVERMKFAAILLFSAVWLLTVYAPVTHWVWAAASWRNGVFWILLAALSFTQPPVRPRWFVRLLSANAAAFQPQSSHRIARF